MTKIDQYQGFTFDGKGCITDHQDCREVIEFNFLPSENDKADKCIQLCLDLLNERGIGFNKSVYDEIQSIYDYFIEVGQDDNAILIWNLAKEMCLLLNKR